MRKLAAYTRGGLADRFALALFSERLANATNRQLEYLWPVESGCFCAFNVLFKPCAFPVTDSPPYTAACRFRGKTFSDLVGKVTKSDAELVHLNGFYGHDFSRFDDVFIPNELIAKKVAKVQSSEFGDRVIGIHIRRRDKECFVIPPVADYFSAIDKKIAENPTSRLFLASDDPEVERCGRDRYGRRLFLHRCESRSRHEPAGIIDALVTLYLLRACNFLITGRYSGFSLLAAWDRPCQIVHVTGTPISRDWEGRPVLQPSSNFLKRSEEENI